MDVAKANVRRHWSLALAGVVVRAELGGLAVEAVTDRHGFVAVTMKVPDIEPGWHEVTVRTVPQRDDIIEEVSCTGRVFKPHPQAPFAVISDLDDTVIRSGLTEGLAAMRRTLLGDQHTRQAIPGMSSFYRGMARAGSVDGVEPGFFYVSTGSWSFYEMLVQFLQLRGFPRGPLFLTDWGPTDRYLHRSGAAHKKHTIGRLMQAYGTTGFVMVGDTGQGDYDAYTDAARHFPDRVKLIVLLPVGDRERDAEVKEMAITARGEGVPVHVVDSVAEAATIALELGLCDSMTLEEVRTSWGRCSDGSRQLAERGVHRLRAVHRISGIVPLDRLSGLDGVDVQRRLGRLLRIADVRRVIRVADEQRIGGFGHEQRHCRRRHGRDRPQPRPFTTTLLSVTALLTSAGRPSP